MTGPTDPHRTDPDRTDPLERELRRTLAARAGDAPDARALTERLLAAGGRDQQRRWRTLGTPLVAAACVAAIAGIVLAVVRPGHSDDGPAAVNSPSLPVPVSSQAAPVPRTRSEGQTSSESPASTSPGPVLRNVRIVDLTFTAANSGWALASADCLTGSGRCTALLRTTDGTGWGTVPNTTPFDVPGVDGCPAVTCVTHIRFADDSVGYAFGPHALFVTRDGAEHWTPVTGAADALETDALETLDGNVIRVVSDHSGCPGPCNVRVETSALDSEVWTSVTLPGGTVDAATVALSRTGRQAFLTISTGSAAAPRGVSLFTSADDGATWTKRADPCTVRVGSSATTQNLSSAADGSVSVLCAGATGGNKAILTSTDGGASFGAPRVVTGDGVVPTPSQGDGLTAIAAVSRRVLVGTGARGLYRSADGGHTWQQVVTDTSVGTVAPPGFESSTVGRWVSPDARHIWTTRDAGTTWTRASS